MTLALSKGCWVEEELRELRVRTPHPGILGLHAVSLVTCCLPLLGLWVSPPCLSILTLLNFPSPSGSFQGSSFFAISRENADKVDSCCHGNHSPNYCAEPGSLCGRGLGKIEK